VIPAGAVADHGVADHLAPANALRAARGDLLGVEARPDLGQQSLLHLARLPARAAEVGPLAGIGLQVEEPPVVAVHLDQLPAPTPGHEARRAHLLDVVLGEDGALLVAQQARAVEREARGRGYAGEVEQRRREVEQRHGPRHARARALAAGQAHDERHPHRPLVEAALLHHAPLGQHVAVVAREEHDRVVRLARLLERPDELAELAVDVGHERVVRPAERPQGVRVVEVDGVRLVRLVRPVVHRGQVDAVGPFGQCDLGALVDVPQLLRDEERVVRVVERDDEEERLVAAAARALAEVLERPELRLLVVRQELRPGGDADARRHVHPRVPAADEAALLVLRGHPVHARRVHVGRQPPAEPVQLVGADEVHLAAEDGLVAGVRQVVGDRRLVGVQLGGVVPAAEVGGVAAGEQRRARGRAERVRRVRGVEDDALARQAVEMRRADDRMAVRAGQERHELVHHDEEDVHGSGSTSAFAAAIRA
jgi:hypothetical protein